MPVSGTYGDFADGKAEDYKKMIDLNDRALVELTYLFLERHAEREKGEIPNVASTFLSSRSGKRRCIMHCAFVLSFSLRPA